VKTIALCTNVPDLNDGGFRDAEKCKRYRGSGWAPYFDRLAKRRGYQLLSGQEAVHLTQLGGVDPKETLVIQEEMNADGEWLIERGADPTLVFTFESPLYTPEFYDRIPEFKKRFRYQMLFSGGTHHVYFPSFDWDEVRSCNDWHKRKDAYCLIAANKHYSRLPAKPDSPSFQEALRNQLHDVRIQTIQSLRQIGKQVDIYGPGWPGSLGCPKDKIEVLSQYKYALCFENVDYHGYFTEKYIDCLVAGTMPNHYGYHDEIADAAYEGDPRKVLYSMGWLYSYPGFAQYVMDILEGKV
jgi:hypothetical protein